ncbi:phosphate ABC transporter phosphate-binding protein [Lipingzhangella halophila]|uniref:Phosphate ABC transporter phosphate-binding protein n=1 Tax=Lipingzhangella halophila TaxID=1783352 RepID=A0A7W7RJA7_9ACTN|nr:substrate-binding domain-containing protein [Lipingzhangella halophila]MBB4932618.1 phosphate ABC transporter phosphate-binding protein [Lipingzhangella halophila]
MTQLEPSAAGNLSPLEPADPQFIPPFRIRGRLGAGGMGVVYGATDPAGAWVALKVIRAECADDADFRARFAREVELMQRVRARCIAPVLAFDTQSAQPWYATTYVPGPTLAQRVKERGALAPEQARVVAAGMAEAIAAIHAAGVVHRDLKPANVMLAPDGPKVLDFGIARAVGETALTRTGGLVGSPGWMSPERFRGEAGPDADIFSWGALVAYSATGRPPFGSGEVANLIYRVLHEEPDLDGLPGSLAGPVAKALSKDPAQRPSAVDLLYRITSPDAAVESDEDATTIVDGFIDQYWRPPTPPPGPGTSGPPDPVPPPPASPAPAPPNGAAPARPARRRGRLLALGAGAAALALAAGIGGMYVLRDTGDSDGAPVDPSTSLVEYSTLAGEMSGAGSTFLGPAMEGWTASYADSRQPDLVIDYSAVGTGAGVEEFIQGEADFHSGELADGSSVDPEAADAHGCPTVQIPVLAGGVVVTLNDPELDGLALDAEALAGIFDGEITTYNDPALVALNPDRELPDTAIVPVRHAETATTAHVFSAYLAEESASWGADRFGSEADWNSAAVEAQGDEGVVAAVEEQPGGLGFVNQYAVVEDGYAAVAEELPQAAVVNADGTEVYPTLEATTEATAQLDFPVGGDLALGEIGGDGYPIIRINRVLASECGYDDDTAAALRDFWTWATQTDAAAELAEGRGYSPLAPTLHEGILERIDRINIGGA